MSLNFSIDSILKHDDSHTAALSAKLVCFNQGIFNLSDQAQGAIAANALNSNLRDVEKLACLNQLSQLSTLGYLEDPFAHLQHLQRVQELYAVNSSNCEIKNDLVNTTSAAAEGLCSPVSDKSMEILSYDECSLEVRPTTSSYTDHVSLSSQSHLQNLSTLANFNLQRKEEGSSISSACSVSSEGDRKGTKIDVFGNKDAPLCTKCKLHGIRNQVKGHKKNCPMKDCGCDLCVLTDYGKRLRGKKKRVAPTLSTEQGSITPRAEVITAENNIVSQNVVINSYAQLALNMLKDRLRSDGLDYESELCRLKDSLLYLLLNQHDKTDLFNKFAAEA